MVGEQHRVLIVEDDRDLGELMVDCLEKAGYEAYHAEDGRAGLRRVWEIRPSLVTLDLVMPHLDGWELLRRIREVSDIPVIIVSVMQEIDDRLKGFDLGVDDFVGKPFSLQEFVARVRARLRNGSELAEEAPACGPFMIDIETQDLVRDGQRVHLTPTEFRLLRYMIENKGKVLSRRQILARVWGTDDENLLSSVKVYMHHLRQKIEDKPTAPQLILTAPYRRGYMFAG